MTANVVRYGPGTFTLGDEATGTAYECQIQSMGIGVNKNTGDTITAMCGDQIVGSITYDYVLAGTALQDFNVAAGLVEYSWTHKGESVPFTFTPTTSAVAVASGVIVMDPLPFGDSAAAYGDILTSDFEWSIQGEPEFDWPPAARTAAASDDLVTA